MNGERHLSEESWLCTGIDFRALAVYNCDVKHKQWPQIVFGLYVHEHMKSIFMYLCISEESHGTPCLVDDNCCH